MVRNKFSGLVVLFVLILALCLFFKTQLASVKVDYRVVLGANLLLFLLGGLSLLLHIRALGKPNPQVFVRSVMLANIIKIFGVAAAALIYISLSGKQTSTNAVFAGMFLYIVYTWVEKRATIQLSKSKPS